MLNHCGTHASALGVNRLNTLPLTAPFRRATRWRRRRKRANKRSVINTMKAAAVLGPADVLISAECAEDHHLCISANAAPHQHTDPQITTPPPSSTLLPKLGSHNVELPDITRKTKLGTFIQATRSLNPAALINGLQDHSDKEFVDRIVNFSLYGVPIGYKGQRSQLTAPNWPSGYKYRDAVERAIPKTL